MEFPIVYLIIILSKVSLSSLAPSQGTRSERNGRSGPEPMFSRNLQAVVDVVVVSYPKI